MISWPRASAGARSLLALLAAGSCLVLCQCGWPDGSSGPSPTSARSSTPQATSEPSRRTVTEANLPAADELPVPLGGGEVETYEKLARPGDKISVCLQEPLTALGASAVVTRSYRDRFAADDRPFPPSPLDAQPNTYVTASQFGDAAAAERAMSIIEGWVVSCRAGVHVPSTIRVLDQSFGWTQLPVPPARAEVAEVVYRERAAKGANSYYESIGLTVLEDRLMVTVHIFFTDESPYSINLGDDESGFAHPQDGLVRLAARRLGG